MRKRPPTSGSFKPGHNGGAKGGPRPNSGRPPEWLRAKCQGIVEDKELIAFLGKVADGGDAEQVVTDKGEAIPVPAAIKERLRAIEMLLDRGWGRSMQPMEVKDTTENPKVTDILSKAVEEDEGEKVEQG